MTGFAPEDGDAPTDSELLRRYVATRAEDAFAELVKRHLDGVYSAALRRVGGDRQLAEDVAQRVFVAVARKAESLSHHPVLTSWLYVTARHESANVVRTERRRKARELEAHTMQEIFSEQEPSADWSRVAPVLDDVVDQLGEADRTAILLRFVDRRAFADIGVALRVSEDAARMRVERALGKLRDLLARRGVTSTAAVLGTALANHAVVAAPAGLAATVTGTALTSAAVTAGPVALAIQFMIISKTVAGMAGVVALVVLGTAVHESNARQAVSDSLATASAEAWRHDARMRELQERAAEAEQARDAARASVAAAATAPKPAPAPAAPPAPDPVVAGREYLAAHPEARELWMERERANIAVKLGPVFQAMSLGDAERERLTTVFASVGGGMTTFNGPNGMIALQREAKLTREQAEAEVQSILGPDRLKRFMELSAAAPTFDFTARMATALYRTDPLTPEQVSRVMQIFVDASPAGRGRGAPPNWDAIAAEAGQVLSPKQVAALSVVRQNFEYQQAVTKLTAPAFNAAFPSPAANPSR